MKGILIDDDTGDLLVVNGRLAVGDVCADVAQRVLEAYPGEFKEMPQLGCYIQQQINGTPDPFWRGNAVAQLRSQGVEVERLSVASDGVEIELK